MPTRHEYTAAMQNPGVRFNHPELAGGRTAQNGSGQPIVYAGQFASVYRITTNGRDHAVRCFVSEAPDRQQRYHAIGHYLNMLRPPGFVAFEYLDRELLVGGERHPVVKMDWVEGLTLERYIDANRNSTAAIQALSVAWRKLMADLLALPLAHNDLQHGNVIVTPTGEILLVDYDGVFIPTFRGLPSPELGHRNYQHPHRTAQDYGEDIDNFPALAIHLGLLAVSRDPSLWGRFHNGDNLLFTKRDLANPGATAVWSTLGNCADPDVGKLTAELQRYCGRPVSQVPALEQILGGPAPAGATPGQPGQRRRLTLRKKPIGRRRSAVPPWTGTTGWRTGAAQPTGQPQTAASKSRIIRLAGFARKSTMVTARAARVATRAVTRSLLAARNRTDRVYWREVSVTDALCLLALLNLPAFTVLALYHLVGNLGSILITYMVCSVVGTALYICRSNCGKK